MSAPSPGPWFVSGVRFRMHGGEWHCINRYDEALKRDENVACVGFDPRTGAGLADARLIAAAPELYEALVLLVAHTDGALIGEENEAIFAKARAAIVKAAPPRSPATTADQ